MTITFWNGKIYSVAFPYIIRFNNGRLIWRNLEGVELTAYATEIQAISVEG